MGQDIVGLEDDPLFYADGSSDHFGLKQPHDSLPAAGHAPRCLITRRSATRESFGHAAWPA
jgi:hypothetical protein